MGCGSISKKIINKEVVSPQDSSNKKKPNSSATTSIASLDLSFSHYNLLVWSSSERLFESIFPEPFMNFSISNTNFTFSITQYMKKPHSLVKDAIVLLAESSSDLNSMRSILNEFPNIPMKFLVSVIDFSSLAQENLFFVDPSQNFFSEFLKSNSAFEKKILAAFQDSDKDMDRLIIQEEAEKLVRKLNFPNSSSQLAEFFKYSSISNHEKINFSQFNYFWRRYGQGGESLKKSFEKFSNFINPFIPVTLEYPQKKYIEKQKNKKSIKITVGPQSECKFGLNFQFGRSAKREEILRDVNHVLGLNIYEFWVAFQAKFKSDQDAQKNLKIVEKMMDSIKKSLLVGVSNGKEIEDSIHLKVMVLGFDIIFCVFCDVSNEIINNALEGLKFIDLAFKSPVDDYIDLKVVSKSNIENLEKSKEKGIIESISEGKIIINAEHWSVFTELVDERTNNQQILKDFYQLNESLSIETPQSHNFKSLAYYLETLLWPIKKINMENVISHQFFKGFGKEIYPEIDIYIRYNNIGGHIGITCEDISKLFF